MKTLFFGLYLMTLVLALQAKADEKMVRIEFEQGMTFTFEKVNNEDSIKQAVFQAEDSEDNNSILELDNNN